VKQIPTSMNSTAIQQYGKGEAGIPVEGQSDSVQPMPTLLSPKPATSIMFSNPYGL
jgi:hypothetical protein